MAENMEQKTEEADWEYLYRDLEIKYQQQGFRLRDALVEIDRIKPVYRRLYKNPFYWFIRPHDPHLCGRFLMRCNSPGDQRPGCGELFWKDSNEEFTDHQGHHYKHAQQTSIWEYIKMRLGLIRFTPREGR